MGHIAHVAKEAIEGQRILKTYGGHEKETRYFEQANEDNRQQYLRKASSMAMAIPVVELFIAFSLAGLITFMLSRRPGISDCRLLCRLSDSCVTADAAYQAPDQDK